MSVFITRYSVSGSYRTEKTDKLHRWRRHVVARGGRVSPPPQSMTNVGKNEDIIVGARAEEKKMRFVSDTVTTTIS